MNYKATLSRHQYEVEFSFCIDEILKFLYAESAYNALSHTHSVQRPYLLTPANKDILKVIVSNGFIEATNRLMAYITNYEFYNIGNDTLSLSLKIPKHLHPTYHKRLHHNIERAIAYYALHHCYSDTSTPKLAESYRNIYKSAIHAILQSLCPR